MSAIAKPALFFSTATGTGASDIAVPVELIIGMTKIDVPAFGSTPAKKQIKVNLNSTQPGNVLDFTFVDATARNTAFAAAKTLIAASV